MRLRRIASNGFVLLALGVILGVTAFVTGWVWIVWGAIVFVAAGVMRLRTGSPVYMGLHGEGIIGGEGDGGQ